MQRSYIFYREGLVRRSQSTSYSDGIRLYRLHSELIELPPGLLPKQLKVPPKVLEAASKKKGWGVGAGHSNTNRWTYHNAHSNHSDYTDWW